MFRNIVLIWLFVIVSCSDVFCRTVSEDNIFDIPGNKKNTHNSSKDVMQCLFSREQIWKNLTGQQDNIDNIFLQRRENVEDIVFYNNDLCVGGVFTSTRLRPIAFSSECIYRYKSRHMEFTSQVYCYDNFGNIADSFMYIFDREVYFHDLRQDNAHINNDIVALSHHVNLYLFGSWLKGNILLKHKHYGCLNDDNTNFIFAGNITLVKSVLAECKFVIFDKIILQCNSINNCDIFSDENNKERKLFLNFPCQFDNNQCGIRKIKDQNLIISYQNNDISDIEWEAFKNIYNCDIKIYFNKLNKGDIEEVEKEDNFDTNNNFIIKFKKPVYYIMFYDSSDKTLEVSFIVDFVKGADFYWKIPVFVYPYVDLKYAISQNHKIYFCVRGGYVVKNLYQKNSKIDGYVSYLTQPKGKYMLDYFNSNFTYRYLYGYYCDTNIGVKIKAPSYIENIQQDDSSICFLNCDFFKLLLLIPFIDIKLTPYYFLTIEIKEKYLHYKFAETNDVKEYGEIVKNKCDGEKYNKIVINKFNFKINYDHRFHSLMFNIDSFITQGKRYLSEGSHIYSTIFEYYFDVKCEYKYKINNNLFFFVNIKNLERIFLHMFTKEDQSRFDKILYNNDDIKLEETQSNAALIMPVGTIVKRDDYKTKHKILLEKNYLGNKKQLMDLSFGLQYCFE